MFNKLTQYIMSSFFIINKTEVKKSRICDALRDEALDAANEAAKLRTKEQFCLSGHFLR